MAKRVVSLINLISKLKNAPFGSSSAQFKFKSPPFGYESTSASASAAHISSMKDEGRGGSSGNSRHNSENREFKYKTKHERIVNC